MLPWRSEKVLSHFREVLPVILHVLSQESFPRASEKLIRNVNQILPELQKSCLWILGNFLGTWREFILKLKETLPPSGKFPEYHERTKNTSGKLLSNFEQNPFELQGTFTRTRKFPLWFKEISSKQQGHSRCTSKSSFRTSRKFISTCLPELWESFYHPQRSSFETSGTSQSFKKIPQELQESSSRRSWNFPQNWNEVSAELYAIFCEFNGTPPEVQRSCRRTLEKLPPYFMGVFQESQWKCSVISISVSEVPRELQKCPSKLQRILPIFETVPLNFR